MNNAERVELWERLRSAGVVAGDPPDEPPATSPWYVRALIGIAGWVAALFLLLFIGSAFAFVFRGATMAFFVGTTLCMAALAALAMLSRSAFAVQFALAISLTGQALIAFALFQAFGWKPATGYFVFALFEGTLAAIAPDPTHRAWSAFVCAAAVWLGLWTLQATALYVPLLAVVFVAIELESPATAAPVWRPIGAGLALGLLVLAPMELVIGGWLAMLLHFETARGAWTAPAVIAALLALTVTRLVAQQRVPWTSTGARIALAGAIAVGVAAWPVPGLVAATIVVIVAFATGQRALMGFGIVAIVVTLAHYYYALAATLAVKSLSLALTGAILLAAAYALRRSERATEALHA